MIKLIPGHSGVLIDIENTEDLLDAVGILITQAGGTDAGHPHLPLLEDLYEAIEQDLE